MAKTKPTRAEILEKHDPHFEDDLERSKIAQERVLRWLNYEGHTVVAPPVLPYPKELLEKESGIG